MDRDKYLEKSINVFYDKLAKLEDEKARATIETILDYVKNTGSTYYLTYKPETKEILDKYWNFFSAHHNNGGYNFSSLAVKHDSYILELLPEFVSYVSGLPIEFVREKEKEMRNVYGLETPPSEHQVANDAVDCLNSYCIKHKLVYFNALFRLKMAIANIVEKERKEWEAIYGESE